MAKIQGRNLVVLYKDGDWKAIAYATTCELDINVQMMEIGSPSAGKWVHCKPKRINWTVTAGHLLSNQQQNVDLFALLKNKTRIQIAFTTAFDHSELPDPPTFRPSYDYNRSGFCYISRLTVTGRRGDFATSSIALAGDGELYDDLHELSDFNDDFNNDFNNQQ